MPRLGRIAPARAGGRRGPATVRWHASFAGDSLRDVAHRLALVKRKNVR
jgi:hypothetical protein